MFYSILVFQQMEVSWSRSGSETKQLEKTGQHDADLATRCNMCILKAVGTACWQFFCTIALIPQHLIYPDAMTILMEDSQFESSAKGSKAGTSDHANKKCSPTWHYMAVYSGTITLWPRSPGRSNMERAQAKAFTSLAANSCLS